MKKREETIYGSSFKEEKQNELLLLSEYPECCNRSIGTDFDASGLFIQWLEEDVSIRVKPSTYEAYYYCVYTYILPFFCAHSLSEPHIRQFVKTIRNHPMLAESSRRKILTIFRIALKDRQVTKTEFNCFTLPKVSAVEVPVLSVREQRALEKVARECRDYRALGALLSLYTGIRLGELCALRWKDLDLDAGTLDIHATVMRTKNFDEGANKTKLIVGTPKSSSSVRKLPLPDFLIKLLKPVCRNRKGTSFFLSDHDAPADPRTFQRFYKKLLQDAGIAEHRFHVVRHTFATRALEVGVDIKTLSELLGHSSATITLKIYAHSLMEQKKIAIGLPLFHLVSPCFCLESSPCLQGGMF